MNLKSLILLEIDDGTRLATGAFGRRKLKIKGKLRSGLMAAALLSAAGCSASVGYRVYDPYRSDYHVWNHDEGVYYDRWVVEAHRPHREFRKLKPDEQREYWTWRHNH